MKNDSTPAWSGPYVLYRASRRGRLLYVGITQRPARDRMAEHARTQPWWHLVEHVDTQILPVANRSAAEAIEADAIKRERPLYNIRHSSTFEGWVTAPTCLHCWQCEQPALDLICYLPNVMRPMWMPCCREHGELWRSTRFATYEVPASAVQSWSDITHLKDHIADRDWFVESDFDRMMRASFMYTAAT